MKMFYLPADLLFTTQLSKPVPYNPMRIRTPQASCLLMHPEYVKFQQAYTNQTVNVEQMCET